MVINNMAEKNVTQEIETVCELVCDKLCKYRETVDEEGECDYIREYGACPLSSLYFWQDYLRW